MGNFESRRGHRYYPGAQMDKVMSEARMIEKELAKKEESEDTKIRKAINTRIQELIQKGFPKDQIFIRLNSEFPNSEFEGFFLEWIQHHYERKDVVARRRNYMGQFRKR